MATPEAAVTAETKTTTIAALKAPATGPSPDATLPEVSAGFASSRAFDLLQRGGKALAASSLVPQIYQNNISNCIIALEMAQRIGASPLMVMQNLYIVYNRPAWSAKFLIACFNQCGRFSPVRYIWSGARGRDDWGCQAWATERATGEKIFGPVITMQLAKDEGWYGRKDSKWKTMPEKMFMYRAAAWMIDTTAPELSMGIKTEEEVHDTFDARPGNDGRFAVDVEGLRKELAGPDVTAAIPSAKSEYVPYFATDTAIAALKAPRGIEDLEKIWVQINVDYDESDRQIPPDVEDCYKACKQVLLVGK